MINILCILSGKIVSFISRTLNVGGGSTWPGHIAVSFNKYFIKDVLKNSKTRVILIAGTNGKTTTGKLIQTILEKSGESVFQNTAGANLLNGIASSIVRHSSIFYGLHYDYAIFEIDENTLSLVLSQITPKSIVLLNLFRDQLDRYGEINTIATKWKTALQNLPKTTSLILNADDPQIAFLGKHTTAKSYYFGLEDKSLHQNTKNHASDTTFCPKCGEKLIFETTYFSHLGVWSCRNCDNRRSKPDLSRSPFYPLPGTYNKYNILAALLTAKKLGVSENNIEASLKDFSPAFGRQELLHMKGKRVQVFLSKNPTSFNESLRTVKELGGKYLLFVLNDRIPDGRDVSWIWDIDFEHLLNNKQHIHVSGDRAWDMDLRIKYADKFSTFNFQFSIAEDLRKAVESSLANTPESETLYILPTYSAMLDVRKILTGKKIL